MIVRLIGLGQWTMEFEQLSELNEANEAVEQAVKAGDRERLHEELQRLVEAAWSNDREVPDDLIVEFNLVLPDVDATLEEVRGLLDSTSEHYGLTPDPGAGLESARSERESWFLATESDALARPGRSTPLRGFSRGGAPRLPSHP